MRGSVRCHHDLSDSENPADLLEASDETLIETIRTRYENDFISDGQLVALEICCCHKFLEVEKENAPPPTGVSSRACESFSHTCSDFNCSYPTGAIRKSLHLGYLGIGLCG